MKFILQSTFFFGFILISTTSFSQVQNTLLLKQVLKDLKLSEKEINMELSINKVLPYSTDKTFFVIPKFINKDDYENYSDYDAYIVIVDNRNGKILNKFYESYAWSSDAINLTSIEIDTGLYNLNENTRAIGIRINYSGSSRPNPYSETSLSLFIPENKKLTRILKDLSISEFHGEWDTNCSGEFEESNSIVDVEKIKSNNFYNLIIKTKMKKTKNIPTNDDCIEKIKYSESIKKIKFNGKSYE